MHREIYQYMRKKALSYEGGESKELTQYQRAQKKLSQRSFENSSQKELARAIDSSQIIYLGDFHTFDQSGRNLLRLLRPLVQSQTPLALGFEFINYEHQHHLEYYAEKTISELEFLDAINYHESWHFPWNHYRQILKIAQKHQLPMLALNSTGSLSERDQLAANTLYHFLLENPEAKLLIFFGELHIMPDRLPKQLQQLFTTKAPKSLIIHQNLDEVYWRQGREQGRKLVVKFNPQEYCLMTSPPWIKYESMIYWYENLCDDPEFDIHEYLVEKGLKTFNSNSNDNFLLVCQEILRALQLRSKITKEELENYNLYDHRKMTFILDKVKRLPQKNLINFYKKMLLTGKIFKVPFSHNLYCPNYSINRLSFLAGAHIFDLLTHNSTYCYEQQALSGSQVDKLSHFLNLNTLSYLSSKIINPFRKCDLYQDIISQIDSPQTNTTTKRHLQLAITILNGTSKTLPNNLKGFPLILLNRTAKTISHLLGDTLYEEFFRESPTKFQKIVELIITTPTPPNYPNLLITAILPNKDYQKNSKRFF
ncbi:MAG: hypothetical protein HN730_13015 [Bdellovibrionales bacterium]|nr:hypothetical protein [Bdellovibrionales bacterium]